jgi:hypothetical protein
MYLTEVLARDFNLIEEKELNGKTELLIKIDNEKVKLNIEKISNRWWGDNIKKPVFSTGFFMIPLTQVLKLVKGLEDLEEYLSKFDKIHIDKIQELIEKDMDNISMDNNEKTFLIKTNSNMKYICIVTPELLLKALYGNLEDQKTINEGIELQKKYSYIKKTGFGFYKNIWYYPGRKNIKTELYKTDIFLILGGLRSNSGLIWTCSDDLANQIRTHL